MLRVEAVCNLGHLGRGASWAAWRQPLQPQGPWPACCPLARLRPRLRVRLGQDWRPLHCPQGLGPPVVGATGVRSRGAQ